MSTIILQPVNKYLLNIVLTRGHPSTPRKLHLGVILTILGPKDTREEVCASSKINWFSNKNCFLSFFLLKLKALGFKMHTEMVLFL